MRKYQKAKPNKAAIKWRKGFNNNPYWPSEIDRIQKSHTTFTPGFLFFSNQQVEV